MKEVLRGRHCISFDTWTRQEIDTVLDVTSHLKVRHAMGESTDLLKNKTLFMIFFEQSTRTRNSLEAAMTQLGGHAHDLTEDKMQISHGESPKDTAKVLSRMGEGIAIRNCFYGIGNTVSQHDRAARGRAARLDAGRRLPSTPGYRRPADHAGILREEPERLEGRDFVGVRDEPRQAGVGPAVADSAVPSLRHGRGGRCAAGVPAAAGHRRQGAAERRAGGREPQVHDTTWTRPCAMRIS